MKRIRARAIVAILVLALVGTAVSAQTYKVAISQIASSAIMEQLVKAIADAAGVTFDIQVVPAARAVYLIEQGQVDIQMPKGIITNPAKLKEQAFDFATTPLSRSAYVLYTAKNKNIDPAELKKGNPKGYKIETAMASVDTWEFAAMPSTNIDASLKKIDSGLIDGYLYSQISTDASLKALGLKSIKRQFYSYSLLGFTIKKGGIGGPVDKVITDGMNKIHASGLYDKIMGDLAKQGDYNNWQP
jgi:polar amino acid transport system substrate-binding protein